MRFSVGENRRKFAGATCLDRKSGVAEGPAVLSIPNEYLLIKAGCYLCNSNSSKQVNLPSGRCEKITSTK